MWNLQGGREREREGKNKVFITYKSTLLSGCCYSTVEILADLLEMAIRIFCQQKPFANDKTDNFKLLNGLLASLKVTQENSLVPEEVVSIAIDGSPIKMYFV